MLGGAISTGYRGWTGLQLLTAGISVPCIIGLVHGKIYRKAFVLTANYSGFPRSIFPWTNPLIVGKLPFCVKERHSQISFADKILLNKLDLVRAGRWGQLLKLQALRDSRGRPPHVGVTRKASPWTSAGNTGGANRVTYHPPELALNVAIESWEIFCGCDFHEVLLPRSGFL